MSADLVQPSSTGDVISQDDLDAVQMSRADYGRLSIEDMALILRLHGEGRTQRAIAAVIGCSQQAICYTLQRVKASQADIQQLMKADTLPQLTNWKKAAEKAADRGDHRPAREFIEAAYPELRPQQGTNSGGGGITINIGQPGKPLEPPTITIEAVGESRNVRSVGADTGPSQYVLTAPVTPVTGESE